MLRILAMLGLAVVAMACADPAPAPRVVFLAIDGADEFVLERLIEDGRLPNFDRLIREGASGSLASLDDYLSPALWTTMATGVTPVEHGITDFTYVDRESGERRLITSNLRLRRAVWDLLSERERSVGVYGWLATWPAYPLNGNLVSAYVPFAFDRDSSMENLARPLKGTWVDGVPDLTYPPELALEMSSVMVRPDRLPEAELQRLADFSTATTDPLESGLLQAIRFTYASDRAFAEIARRRFLDAPPDFHTVYLGGIDVLSHRFWHYSFESPQTATPEERRRFGRAIPEMYEFVDRQIGWYLERLEEDTTLVVCSDHGFKAIPGHDGHTLNSGEHRGFGVILLFGNGINPGVRLERPQILDVAPTLLALLGLPQAEDLRGRVLTEALVPGFAPIDEWIPTYEVSPFHVGGDEAVASSVDEALLERLRSLGYINDDD